MLSNSKGVAKPAIYVKEGSNLSDVIYEWTLSLKLDARLMQLYIFFVADTKSCCGKSPITSGVDFIKPKICTTKCQNI